jgi:hypothetical protein
MKPSWTLIPTKPTAPVGGAACPQCDRFRPSDNVKKAPQMNYLDIVVLVALAFLCSGIVTAIVEFFVTWRNRD